MPDPHKLAALAEHGYQLLKACGNCVHGSFVKGRDWGSCDKITYQHAKHSGQKPVSINRYGVCNDVKLATNALEDEARSGFNIFRAIE